jgi:hypothetical protein
MTATSFPWGTVISNAVWICGLAVILAALSWHDYKRHGRAGAPDALMKPVLLGLTMVAGGGALSVHGPVTAALLAAAAFGLAIVLVKRLIKNAGDAAAKNRQVGMIREGLDLGTNGVPPTTRDELHDRR